MLARKIILGFGFTVVLPLLVHYGVDAVYSAPDVRGQQTEIGRLYTRERDASGEEKERLRERREQLENEKRALERASSRVHFFAGAPIGIAATLIGSLAPAPIGGGLMLGGILTFSGGCFFYWDDLPPVGRFAVLLVAFGVLLWIGYQRLAELWPKPRAS